MSSIDELVAQGHTTMRLPQWNEHAYATVHVTPRGQVGPWMKVFDVGHGVGGGEPVSVLLFQADQTEEWEPGAEPSMSKGDDDHG